MKKILKQYSKRTISLMLALVLALGVFLTNAGWQIVKAAENYTQEDKVLYDSNYDNAWPYVEDAAVDFYWYGNANLYNKYGDVWGRLDPDDTTNKVVSYRHYRDGIGVLLLGDDYTGYNNSADTAITVKKGATYQINFKYKAKGTPGSDLEIGIALNSGNDKKTCSQFENVATLPKGVACDNKWKECSVYYTVDSETDITTNNKLCIYLKNGQPVVMCFDDVKVTECAGIKVNYAIDGKTTTVFYGDGNIPAELPKGIVATTGDGKVLKLYEDAEYTKSFAIASYKRTGKYEEKTIYGRYEDFRYEKDTVLFESNYENALATDSVETFKKVSNQLYPKQEEDNKYLYYAQYDNTIGILRLGHSYADTKRDEYEPVKVTPGQSYVIEFDYRLKPYLDTTKYPDWPTSNLTLGVAVGSARDDYSAVTHTTYFDTTSWHTDIEVLALQSSKPDVDWTHKSITVTIPNDCDVSKYNALQLYATLGQRCGLHIDNVKVTALAGVSVNYVVGDNTISAYYADGEIPAAIPAGLDEADASGNVLALYTDEGCTQKFVAENYVRTGEYTTVTLYGKYEPFKYEADEELANNNFDGAVKLDKTTHKNSGDLYPVADPQDASDTVLRYRQGWYGLGVAQLGYDYKDVNGQDDLKDYVRVHNGMTYKVTFDYLVQGTAKNNNCQVGVAIGAPIYKYGNEIHQSNYLTEGVAWYRELLSIKNGDTVDTGWQTMTIYVTVDKDTDISKYNALQLYGKGGSSSISVYFDNIKVYGLANRSYTVKFNVNGGNAMADKTVDLASLNTLPQATRSNAVFMGWYMDAALTKPFDLDNYVTVNEPATTKAIILYAKWHVFTNGAVNSMDSTLYWQNANGTYASGRFGETFYPVVENGNHVIKYACGYAASKAESVSDRGVNVTSASDVYPARMTLYNPDLTVSGDFDFLDVTYRAKVGKTYKVSFSYKVTDVDTKNSEKGIAFSVLTGNVINSHDEWIIHSSRFVVETATTGWKTATTYVTVKSLGKDVVRQGVSSYSDAIMLGVAGYGSALIDNISVTDWDIEAPTYVTFATKGGESIPSQEYVISGSTVLPKAVRSGYTFEGWYTDAKCTKKFNAASYKRTNGLLTLYAGYKGMQGVTEIDFEECGYLKNSSGTLAGNKIAPQYNLYTENGNTVARYRLRYSDKKQAEENRDDSYGNYGTYGGAIGLFDPSVCMSPNWTDKDAVLTVEEGQKYWVSFQYKVNKVDAESTYPAAILFAVGTTMDNSVYSGRQYFGSTFNPVDEPTDGWKTASTYFTVPKLTEGGNRLTLFTHGYGEVLIDNIKIMQLTDAVVFDTDGGTVTEPFRGTVGQAVTLPTNPERADSKFIGWCTDENRTQEYSVGKLEKGVKVVYAKFLTYQTIQDYEHWNDGLSERFESDHYLNKKTEDTDQTQYRQWLGSKFEPENVRNGKVSVKRLGDNQYSRYLGFFYMNNPLTIGEEYELSFWVKVTDYFMAGDIQLAFSDVITSLRQDAGWSSQQRGARLETIISTDEMKEHVGEWIEIKYTFTAKARYAGITTPGITTMYIDDVCMTLTSADDSYARTIEGDGLKWEEWHKEPVKEVEKEEETIVDETPVEKEGLPTWAWILIAAGNIVLIAGVATAIVLIRKKKHAVKVPKEETKKNEEKK